MSLRKCPNCSRILSSSESDLVTCPKCAFNFSDPSSSIAALKTTPSDMESNVSRYIWSIIAIAVSPFLLIFANFQTHEDGSITFWVFPVALAATCFICGVIEFIHRTTTYFLNEADWLDKLFHGAKCACLIAFGLSLAIFTEPVDNSYDSDKKLKEIMADLPKIQIEPIEQNFNKAIGLPEDYEKLSSDPNKNARPYLEFLRQQKDDSAKTLSFWTKPDNNRNSKSYQLEFGDNLSQSD